MKMAPIPPLRSRFAALAPANLRDTLNRHSRIVNIIAVLILLLVLADVTGGLASLAGWFSSKRSLATQPPSRAVYVWVLHCPARHITAMVSDGNGGAWVASEDSGIYHYQPNARRHWTCYDKANSPGLVSNHICSLCLDAKKRLWAGTDRHGVCVFNGVKWQHYGLLDGPLGSHVVAIVSDPYGKSVWMCTEAGVSIYETGKHTWRYIPQAVPGKSNGLTANGLPPNPDCVAFNRAGVAFVGTQCNGLAIGYPPYNRWWMVTGPWQIPITPFGKGLPSSLINAVAVGKGGRVYVATDEGLAWNSRKNPFAFQYERGADYAMKDKQLWHPPPGFKMPPRKFLSRLLPADHITCLAVDSQGKLWLGTWHSGLWTNAARGPGAPAQGDIKEMTRAIVRFNTVWRARRAIMARWAKAHKTAAASSAAARPPALPPLPPHTRFQVNRLDVSAVLPLGNGAVLIGHHCVGVSELRLAPSPSQRDGGVIGALAWLGRRMLWPPQHPSLPAPAKAPTTGQLAALYQKLLQNNLPPQSKEPRVMPITDDWRTQGSWLGRYGRYWACLFAYIPPPGVGDYVWAPGSLALDHTEGIGPHHRMRARGQYHLPDGDAVRYWVQWPFTAHRGSLELPEVYFDQCVATGATISKLDRRQSEIDDHGETYPPTWQGPDLYVYLHIPAGAYTLSLYFKQRHFQRRRNRLYHMGRDQVISLIPLPGHFDFGTVLNPNTAPLASMRGEVQSRVVNFYGGVWKRFLIRGPMKLAIRIARNYSVNTILSGAMLDPLAEHPAPYYYGYRAWQTHENQRKAFRTQLAVAWRNGKLSGDSSVGSARWRRHPVDDSTGNPPAKSANNRGVAMAADIMQALNLLEHRDPAVWATDQRLAYISVLRWCAACYGATPINPTVAAVAEKCYYHLGLFYNWESAEKSRGMLTSRQIEKGLRWDGGTVNYKGLEYTVIRRSIAAHSATSGAAEAANIPAPGVFGSLRPHNGSAAPLAVRLVRILGIPRHGASYLPMLARVCNYLVRAVHPGVRRPIRTALGGAVPLVARLVAAINRGAPPTLLREKILNTITLSGYDIPRPGEGWKYGNVRERRALSAFLAQRGEQLLRSGSRTTAARWEIASVMLASQDDVALGTVGVLGRYLPATPGSPMYEPSALPRDIVRKLRDICERRLSDDTRFYFRAYGLEALARKQLERKRSLPPGVRKAYLARLRAMIGKAARGSLSRQYFFLRRMIAVQRAWGLGTHYRMATEAVNALAGWRQALVPARKLPSASRKALLRWIREALLGSGRTAVPSGEAGRGELSESRIFSPSCTVRESVNSVFFQGVFYAKSH